MSDSPPTKESGYACGHCGKVITDGCYCSDACSNADERLGPLPVLLEPKRLRYLKALAKEYMAAGKPQGLVELAAHIEALEMAARLAPEPKEKVGDIPRALTYLAEARRLLHDNAYFSTLDALDEIELSLKTNSSSEPEGYRAALSEYEGEQAERLRDFVMAADWFDPVTMAGRSAVDVVIERLGLTKVEK